MTPLADFLAAARATDAGLAASIPSDWMQGRTAYGGLSAALALHAALAVEPDLPPLRSAQIAFIGPLAGDVTVTANRLRRGRNAAFVQADVVGEAGLGLRATFVFMAPIPSKVTHDIFPVATVGIPDEAAKLYTGPDGFFTGNFNFHDLKNGTGTAEWLRWGRLRAHDGLRGDVELIAIADALPPAAFKLMDGPAPISTLTWQLNMLTPAPATRDGWWLLAADTAYAVDGFSNQRMTIWNADGQPVADAVQGVALFG